VLIAAGLAEWVDVARVIYVLGQLLGKDASLSHLIRRRPGAEAETHNKRTLC
jgi:hypothetical protein